MNYFFLTGSSSGIGLALAQALLKEGKNHVIGLSRHNALEHDRYTYKPVDLAQIEKLIPQLPELFDIDTNEEIKQVVLINNAGTLGEVGYIGELEAEKLPEIYNVNLIAPALLINEFLRKFKEIVPTVLILNVSSGAGGYPVDGWSGYCATKAGINMLGEVVAMEQEKRGSNVKIFNLAPGVVDTGMQEKIRKSDSQQFSGVQKFINLKEQQALADPAEVAQSIIHLLKNPHQYKEVKQDVRAF